jgi:peptidoglycan/xylan/chitin deacetylase (PgdA/CDA1 family)
MLALFATWQISKARCFTLTGAVTCRVKTQTRAVALTFDDGPTEHGVTQVATVLKSHGARATFFLIGREAKEKPELVRRLIADGHEIGNHSYSHRQMLLQSKSYYGEEIRRTDEALRQAGVARPRWFRPPFGKKLVGLPRAVAEEGYSMVTWDVEEPSAAAQPQAYADEVLKRVRPGSIIIMHVMYKANAPARAALPLILAGLKSRGYQVVTVGELMVSKQSAK